MALSTLKVRAGSVWPLGFIAVANNGTPAGIMSRVDANNVNAPGTSSNNLTSEYTTTVRSIWFQGVSPGSNNNGMVNNSGNIYVNFNPSGNNNQNRADSGSMVMVVPPGGSAPLPGSLGDPGTRFSPYQYTIDSDVDGEGALVTLIGPMGQ